MIEAVAGYQSPSMISDPEIRESLNAFIAQTLAALSTPRSDAAAYFVDPDVAIAGSTLGEFYMGPEAAQNGITFVTTLKVGWDPQVVVSWMRGDMAWAQIRVNCHVVENGSPAIAPYIVTGIFKRNGARWTWLYWGGSEPQRPSRV